MRPTPIALSLAVAFAALPLAAVATTAAPPDPAQVTELGGVSVSGAVDASRNALSPDTGSSQYVLDRQAIAQLPLGDATPVNQVLLQAPGVVQDAHGDLHVRGDHGNLQYRIDGVIVPESIAGFGQVLDARTIESIKLLDGALPAQYGLRTAAVVDITTRDGRRLGNGGSVGVTVGSFGTLNPEASVWGSHDRWSWFLTGNYLQTDAGIENPTAGRSPLHDRSHQARGFGKIGYRIGPHARLGLLFGVSDNRFQIPDRPGEQPRYAYLDTVAFDSARLDERQREASRFAALSLQGRAGQTDYQLAIGQRYASLDFRPDRVGDLMFNGIASTIDRSSRASTLQADFTTPLGEDHTLRYGLYGSLERAPATNDAWVFPADAAGNQTSTTPIRILDRHRLTARTASVYVQDAWNIGDRLTVDTGLRADRYQALRTESQLSPRLGLVYQASDDTVLHAGYARYFTPPASEAVTSTDIARFAGTTNALPDYGDTTPLAERTDYLDAGISQNLGPHLTLGVDAYDRRVRRLQDEGQFGAALVYSTFNFATGRIRGVEFTANYGDGPLSAYLNLAVSRATGRRVITGQYNFAADDLAYIAGHDIFLDHDQRLAASGGVSYALGADTRLGADFLFGSGMRRDGAVPNGASLPAYLQLNLSASRDFRFDATGALHAQLALINALDRSYALRDGSGIGVGAPQYGPRRGLYLSVRKDL